jgi:RNA polymerase sigma-70 factor, ECF subfamily
VSTVETDFISATEPYRGELLALCRRMMGSMQDAEDQLQETYLRAWRSYDQFQGRSSLRTWLYRIATNVCLTALESRQRIPVPAGLAEVGDELPDTELTDPAAIVTSRDDRRRALLVTWKHLSARQRAVLILRDVLNWQAAEIADLLDTTPTAVHSMLRRARTRLEEAPAEASSTEAAFLEEYASAFETGDLSGLVRLLHEDAVCEFRSSATTITGRDAILRQLARCPAVGHSRMLPVTVDGKPGFAVYSKRDDGAYTPYTIDVLTTTATGFRRIDVLEGRHQFTELGLPAVLP